MWTPHLSKKLVSNGPPLYLDTGYERADKQYTFIFCVKSLDAFRAEWYWRKTKLYIGERVLQYMYNSIITTKLETIFTASVWIIDAFSSLYFYLESRVVYLKNAGWRNVNLTI